MAQQQDESLRNSLIVSASLHVGTLIFLYVGLPVFFAPPPAPPWRPVPIDIVEIGAITNTRIQNTPEESAKTAPPTKPAPAPEIKQPEPPKPPTPPETKAAKAEPAPDEAALPKPQSKPKPPEPPKQQAQQQADPLASVLKNVAKMKPAAPTPQDARPADTKNDGTTSVGASNNKGPALSDRLTISQEDALRRQISGCWNMPIGARNAQDLIVEVLIEVNPDRTVRSAQVVDQLRMAGDSHFRAAAEAALRALRHPKCSPLELPPDQYEQWKTVRFNFDPRDML